jgi:3-dehydroquinate synthase
MQAFELRLRAGSTRRSPVRIGRGVLDLLVEDLLVRSPTGRIVLISDSNVSPLHARPLRRRLRDGGARADLLVFPAGEASKNRETKSRLEDRLASSGVGRDAVIVAVGGGVTGDLAGFTAATWHRGIPVIQVPTSLLAMADAAIGGKTGVDLPGGKNLVGAFHQPDGVYADLETLRTLPEGEFRAGMAELVKAAVVADSRLFRRLEQDRPALLGRDENSLEEVLARCLRIKAAVVTRDEREKGRRAILNFGHTVGHAVEAVSGYRIRHGEAVSIGMVVEGKLAADTTGFPEAHAKRLEALLRGFGLPTSWPVGLRLAGVMEALGRDKKTRAGRPRYALPRAIGRMMPGDEVTLEVDGSRLRAAVRALRGAGRAGRPD